MSQIKKCREYRNTACWRVPEYLTVVAMDIHDIITLAGGPRRVAREIERSHVAVLGWTRVPAHHVMAIVRLTGLAPHQIRPDVFPAPESATT